MKDILLALTLLLSAMLAVTSFQMNRNNMLLSRTILSSTEQPADPPSSTKGFGKPQSKPLAEAVEKDAGTLKYERDQKRGVPEYNVFMRPTNGTDGEWVPVGSMTIPRDTDPAKAIFEVEKELLVGTFKLYPKLKAFYDVRSEKEGTFEYGYVLKAFPDEEIKICRKTVAQEKNFFSSWLGKITNPLDTTDLRDKGQMTLKQ